MSVVNLTIGKKSYQLSCDDGNEPRLRKLAGDLDAKLKQIAAGAPGAGDSTLLVMLALMLQDEVAELREKAPIHPSESIPNGMSRDHERTVIEALDMVSEFVEHLANKVQSR